MLKIDKLKYLKDWLCYMCFNKCKATYDEDFFKDDCRYCDYSIISSGRFNKVKKS